LRQFGAIAARAAGSLRPGNSKYSTYQTAMHKVKSHMVQFIFTQVSLVTEDILLAADESNSYGGA